MKWSNQTQSARMSVFYITAGALIDVWTVAYYFFVMRPTAARNPAEVSDSAWFWLAGFFFTGLALLAIGLLLGQIGRAAAKAEVASTAAQPIPDQAQVQPVVQQAPPPPIGYQQPMPPQPPSSRVG
jgi:hypothetical protein